MADVKRAGALGEILALAGELANKMASISIRLEVGPDLETTNELLERWRAAHQSVEFARVDLDKLADVLARSTSYVVILG